MKVAMTVAVVCGLIFLQLSLHRGLGYLILSTCFLFGMFGLATYPVGLELSAECAYPVEETTSTGLIVLSGQVQSIIYIALITLLAKPLQPEYMEYQVCTAIAAEQAEQTVKPEDMTISVIVCACTHISSIDTQMTKCV